MKGQGLVGPWPGAHMGPCPLPGLLGGHGPCQTSWAAIPPHGEVGVEALAVLEARLDTTAAGTTSREDGLRAAAGSSGVER